MNSHPLFRNGTAPAGRVFLVSPTESPLTRRGNRDPVLAERLVCAGLRVTYIGSTIDHSSKSVFSAAQAQAATSAAPYELVLLNMGAYPKNISLRRIAWNRRFARSCAKTIGPRASAGDVLVVPSRPTELVRAAAELKDRIGVRLLMDIRDVWPDCMVGGNPLLRLGFFAYCNSHLRGSVSLFDAFVHVAPSFLKWLRRHAPDAVSAFLPLGYDPHRWQHVQPKTSAPTFPISLVHCGSLSYQLDVMPVVEALRGRRDRFHLTLIGEDGSGSRYRDVTRSVERHGLRDCVTIEDYVPPDVLARRLPGFDIALVPMVSGAMPTKVFDALAAGLPILSLGEGDATDLVREHDAGWSASFDGQAVGDLLDRLTPEEILQKATRAFGIREQFSRDGIYSRYVGIVLDLLNRKSR